MRSTAARKITNGSRGLLGTKPSSANRIASGSTLAKPGRVRLGGMRDTARFQRTRGPVLACRNRRGEGAWTVPDQALGDFVEAAEQDVRGARLQGLRPGEAPARRAECQAGAAGGFEVADFVADAQDVRRQNAA